MKKHLLVTIIFALSGFFASAKIYTSYFNNHAAGGYDVVSYFTQKQPVKGNKKYQTKYQGVVWFFSSKQNLDAFNANQQKYAPQYGGHCAWAVGAKNQLVKGDPKYWKIVDGKLYLNYDARVQKTWEEDIPNFIRKADSNWPKISK